MTQSPADTRKLHILLVEDLLINRRVAVAFLEKHGHQVSPASTGEEALAVASQHYFDLVLMDIRLPDIDGTEVARRLRASADARTAGTPILALTANVFPEDVETYRQAGMNGVIAKPIEETQFRLAIQAVTSQTSGAGSGAGPARPSPAETLAMSWDSSSPLDEDFISERLLTLGNSSFCTVLQLGRRSVISAVEEVRRNHALCLEGTGPADSLARSAHKLAGAASNFGFSGLFALGRDIEDAIGRQDMDTGLALASRVEEHHRQLESSLEEWLQRHHLQ